MTLSDKDIIQVLNDICLELQDNGFIVRIERITRYTRNSFCNITIVRPKQELFNGSQVSGEFIRLHDFMYEQGWRMWVDIHLYTDYHYNNGYLDFKYLSNERREEFFDIIRYKLEKGIKSIKFQFVK